MNLQAGGPIQNELTERSRRQRERTATQKLNVSNVDLRGPAAILSISRDTCSDSIAKLSRACFYGVSHNYRAIRCKMGYRTDVPV